MMRLCCDIAEALGLALTLELMVQNVFLRFPFVFPSFFYVMPLVPTVICGEKCVFNLKVETRRGKRAKNLCVFN